MERQLKVLLLYNLACGEGTISDHVNAIKAYSNQQIYPVEIFGALPAGIDLSYFDVVIVHYSLVLSNLYYIDQDLRDRLKKFQGLKCAFIQDEYRFINKTVAAIKAMDFRVVFTVVPEKIVEVIYPTEKLPEVHKEILLTGYVPEKLLTIDVPALSEREVDVSYRARKLPFWLGSQGQEKWKIGEKFSHDAKQHGLHCDIDSAENSRIYGDNWLDFISSSKAVLGVESTISVMDFTGEIQAAVDAYLKKHADASFDLIYEKFLKKVDGQHVINVISPRCFEAAALRTLMILYEGEYSGRLIPWRHYLPLKKDHSNMAEIMAWLSDADKIQQIVDTAYVEVASAYENSYRCMVDNVDRVLEKKRSRVFSAQNSGQDLALVIRLSIAKAIEIATEAPKSLEQSMWRLTLRVGIRGLLKKTPHYFYSCGARCCKATKSKTTKIWSSFSYLQVTLLMQFKVLQGYLIHYATIVAGITKNIPRLLCKPFRWRDRQKQSV